MSLLQFPVTKVTVRRGREEEVAAAAGAATAADIRRGVSFGLGMEVGIGAHRAIGKEIKKRKIHTNKNERNEQEEPAMQH